MRSLPLGVLCDILGCRRRSSFKRRQVIFPLINFPLALLLQKWRTLVQIRSFFASKRFLRPFLTYTYKLGGESPAWP